MAFYTKEIEDPATKHEAAKLVGSVSQLVKVRLNALVLVTAAAGFLAANTTDPDWMAFAGMLAGTGLCAASASMFNQLIEARRDGLMIRTQERPMPRKRFARWLVFAGAMATGYAGWALLLLSVGWLPALLAAGNIVIYAVIYTPLKPLTTLNTIVGAVCGAIPPMVGWSAATGSLEPGAWVLGGLLFVWQIPHFMALGWMYRDDYRRGGFAMLPVLDPSGQITAQTTVLTSLILIPLGLSATVYGVAGWWYSGCAFLLGGWMVVESFRFLHSRTDPNARRLFFASIAYLPLLLAAMVIDRGPVSPTAATRGGNFVLTPSGPIEQTKP